MNPDDIGFVMLDCGEHERALLHFEDALARDKDDSGALHMKILALYRLGRYEETLESCGEAIRIAYATSKKGLDKAKRLRALGENDEAEEWEFDAKEYDLYVSNVKYVMSKALFRLERTGEALTALNSGIGLDDDHYDEHAILELILREVCFKEDYGLACRRRRFGRGAAPFYGHAACAPGRKAKLVNDLNQTTDAASIRPNDAAAQADLARILLHLAVPERALMAIIHAISLDPSNVRYHVTKAEILCDLGEMGRCGKAADAALEIDPDDPDARIWKGLCLYEDGYDTEGIPMIEEELARDESNPTACLCHAYVLACEEDPNEALELCVPAMMDHPHDDRLRALLEAMLEERANHP